jgi:hypothetical protein
MFGVQLPFASKGGHQYYIVFIDDIYFMYSHGEDLSIYKLFVAMVHTHLSRPIRVFRANSIGEYISKHLRGVLAEEGTLAQFSCPNAHAQNGVSLRKHLHLLEIARAMMISSSLLPHFRAEAISTSAYLINIQPSVALQAGIPLERLHDCSPASSVWLLAIVYRLSWSR